MIVLWETLIVIFEHKKYFLKSFVCIAPLPVHILSYIILEINIFSENLWLNNLSAKFSKILQFLYHIKLNLSMNNTNKDINKLRYLFERSLVVGF